MRLPCRACGAGREADLESVLDSHTRAGNGLRVESQAARSGACCLLSLWYSVLCDVRLRRMGDTSHKACGTPHASVTDGKSP